MLGRGLVVISLLIVAPGVGVAQNSPCGGGEKTCKGPGNQAPCCRTWVADIFVRGKKQFGLVVGDTYKELQRALEHKKNEINPALCRWFGRSDDSCHTRYGKPRCSGQITGDFTAELEREALMDSLDPAGWRLPSKMASIVMTSIGAMRSKRVPPTELRRRAMQAIGSDPRMSKLRTHIPFMAKSKHGRDALIGLIVLERHRHREPAAKDAWDRIVATASASTTSRPLRFAEAARARAKQRLRPEAYQQAIRSYEQLRQGASKLAGSRNPYAGIGGVLSGYATNLRHATEKLDLLHACMKRDLQQPLADVEAGAASATDPDLAMWSVGGSFGGRQEMTNYQRASLEHLSELQVESSGLDRLLEIPIIELNRDFDVRQRRRKGRGRLIFGRHGPVNGTLAPRGSVPLGFVSSKGTVGTVTVEERSTRHGLEITITGRAGGERESITLIDGSDRDGDDVPNYRDRCPDQRGDPKNRGCPWPDRDKDGVADRDDKCPKKAGIPERRGCPYKSKRPPLAYYDTAAKRWGYKDSYNNHVVIRPTFQTAKPFFEGLAAVQIGNRGVLSDPWGFIDTSGQVVIPPRFVMVGRFANGLAAARSPGSQRWGYIDRTGRYVIPARFATISMNKPYCMRRDGCSGNFEIGKAWVCEDVSSTTCYYIDKRGRRVP